MIYQNRDQGIGRMRARKNHACYGMGIGIMILDDVYPGFPGDVGIVCYQKQFLTPTHLEKVGIRPDSNYKIAGAGDEYGCTELDKLWNWEVRPEIPEADYAVQEEQMVSTCEKFCRKNPGIGAIMLECTGMQPFARAIQQRIDLPVFSWGTILDYAYSVVAHRDYYGHV
jgi:hypothetical protein